MKKISLFFVLLIVLFSCEKEESEPITTLTELNYPIGMGTSGDKTFSVVGYGFDATGLCDTISVKAKIAEIPESDYLYLYGWPRESGSELVSDRSLTNLLGNLNNLPFKSHISNLLNIATNTSKDVHVVYYSSYWKYFFVHILVPENSIKPYLTSNFKDDIISLSTSELVLKYGTHVLASIDTGIKFEIIYTCQSNKYTSDYDLEQQFLKRLKQLIGGTPYIIPSEYKCKSSYFDEKVIYNTIGSKNKLVGLINVTDNNSDGIGIDYNSIFIGEETDLKFLDIWSHDGMVSLDNFINDPIKKQEVKEYIEAYIDSKSLLIGE